MAELAARILTYLGNRSISERHRAAADVVHASEPRALQTVLGVLAVGTGEDYALDKPSTLYRRLDRRMGLHRCCEIADYVEYLRDNPTEADLPFNEPLIGVTRFLRDETVWQALRTTLLPALLARSTGRATQRAWVAGCSTGEAACSPAMVFREVVDGLLPERRCSYRRKFGESIAVLERIPLNRDGELAPSTLTFQLADTAGTLIAERTRRGALAAP